MTPLKSPLNSITYCCRDVFKHLPCFLVVAHFFIALPLQVPLNEHLKIEPVQQETATQERICVPVSYKHCVQTNEWINGESHRYWERDVD